MGNQIYLAPCSVNYSDKMHEVVRGYPAIIGGEEAPVSDNFGEVRKPSTGEVFARYRLSEKDDVERAILSANAGKEIMFEIPPWKISKLFRRVAETVEKKRDFFRELLAHEGGKIWKDAEGEITRSIAVLNLAAEECTRIEGTLHDPRAYEYPPGNETRFAYSKFEPVGTVVAITPWNYPLLGPVHKIAPALAARNAVILKPASLTPLSSIELGKILVESGFPKEAISVIPGPGRIVGKLLVESRGTDFVTLTGDTTTGLSVAAEASRMGKRSIMELGGMDPLILLNDGNLDKAVADATKGAFTHAGQVCIASKRMIVQEEIADKFVQKLKENAQNLRVGDPLNEKTDMGPMIDEDSLMRVDSIVPSDVSSGAKVLVGGGRSKDEKLAKGHFYLPTVVDNVTIDMRLNLEEPFGPIAPVIRVSSVDEAIEAANHNPFGLNSSVYTSNLGLAIKIADRIKAGGVRINDPPNVRWDNLPHGGIKKSGFGREGVKYAMKEMMNLKTVGINLQ